MTKIINIFIINIFFSEVKNYDLIYKKGRKAHYDLFISSNSRHLLHCTDS